MIKEQDDFIQTTADFIDTYGIRTTLMAFLLGVSRVEWKYKKPSNPEVVNTLVGLIEKIK